MALKTKWKDEKLLVSLSVMNSTTGIMGKNEINKYIMSRWKTNDKC